MNLFLIILLGYLLGSIPFALVIGKVFFKKDIRNYGSKNLGGGNAGRVLGKKAGLAVMALDLLKVTLVVFLAQHFIGTELAAICGGLAAAIGHCYPVFANFRGGKAVATMYGFLFGLVVFASYSPLIFALPMVVFLLVLYLSKIIALASICSAIAASIYVFLCFDSIALKAAMLIFTFIIIVRHRKNLERMAKHEENKISWM